MSGIVAMFSEDRPVDPARLARATRQLAHRGPDDQRLWVDAAHSVGLGHTRLATGAVQPAVSEDGTVRAIIDGAIYDGERLRGELLAHGHRVRSRDDAELLVQLYARHGSSLVDHLRGELAFALYDADRDLLIAGRDRCGVKPLVYSRHAGVLILASEVKALLAAGVPAAWDAEAFLQTCVLGGPIEGMTMFAGVRRLPAGHLMLAGRGAARLVRYWDFDYPIEATHDDDDRIAESETDDREALEAALAMAVQLRIRADPPVACYLGGLDASALLGLAHRDGPPPKQAFTIGFGGGFTEEQALANELAVRAGVLHTPIPLRPAELARDLEEVLFAVERPLHNVSCVLTFQLARGVGDAGFQRVITGDGSDELFAGYAHLRPDLAYAAQRGAPADADRHAGRSPPGAAPPPGGPRMSIAPVAAALGGFAPTWLRSMALSGSAIVGLLRPEYRMRLLRGEPFARFIDGLDVSRRLRDRHPVHQAMYLWSKSVLPSYTLSATVDAVHMAHGVECRLPFLDPRVVELSTRLAIDRLIRGDVEKYLLREAARPVISDAIYRRPKDRQVVPEAIALEARVLDELLHDTLRSPRLTATPFFEPASVIALLDALPERDAAARWRLHPALMMTLTTCLLQQRFAIGDAHAAA